MNSGSSSASKADREHRLQSGRIIGLFPELLGVGGVQEAGRLTAAALSNIVASGNMELLSLNDAPGMQETKLNGRPFTLRGFGRSKVQFTLSGIGRAHQFRHEPAGIILAAHPHLALPGALMQRFFPQSRMVVMAHGVEVWNTLSFLRGRALLRAAAVLAPSRYTAQRLAGVQAVAREKIRVLPWPLNPDFLQMAVDPARLPLPSQFPDGEVILTVGRWSAAERYKGADELIRAVAELRPRYPGLRLIAVGGGDDLPRLSQLARSLGVAGNVLFFEHLSREQIAACYSRADIFALPSTGEGFGLVFLEAMAFAKPVVAADFGGSTDVVEHDVNGMLVSPHDIHQLVAALDTLLGDAPRRARMGRAGAEIVQKKYCFAAFESELRRILAECGLPETHDDSLPTPE